VSATWSGTIVLGHAPEVVWDFLTSEANDVNWRAPWLRSVRRLSEGPVSVGTRYESVYRFFGRDEAVIVELTEVDAPLRLAWRQVNHGSLAINDGSYRLEPVVGGTRFTVTGIFASRGLSRLFDPPFAAYLNRASKRQLAQLASSLGSRP
jgi:Polyketide cyclase / dehydrase and lipid transport